MAVHLNHVPDADSPVKHQNKAADEVVDEGLGAKADADGQRTTEEGKDRQGDIDEDEGADKDGDEHQVGRQLRAELSTVLVQLQPVDRRPAYHPFEMTDHPSAYKQDQDSYYDLGDGDAARPDYLLVVNDDGFFGDIQLRIPEALCHGGQCGKRAAD